MMAVISLMSFKTLEAGFSNSGRMQSKNLTLSVGGTLDNNGELIGSESANLSCDTLSGKGLIQSPQITIQTETFAYKGTIDCSGICTIRSAQPFDEKMFTRKGAGKFIITIDPKLKKKGPSPVIFDYVIDDQLVITDFDH